MWIYYMPSYTPHTYHFIQKSGGELAQRQESYVLVPVLQVTSCVTTGKLLEVSGLHFPHM